jgi:two-component system, NarL family, response regulator LiaR
MDADEARISVLIVDDHRSFGEALGVALGKEADLDIVGVAADGESAVEAAEARRPDVALVDLQMPGIDGLETSRRIRAVSKETAVVVLTGSEDELALGRAIQAGAHGFLRKTAAVQDLAGAVRAAHRGEPLNAHDEIEFALRRLRRLRARDDDIAHRFDRLTPRELQILQLLADGGTSDHIASRLDVSRNTLRTHIQNILMKLGVHSKLDAIVAAIRHGRVSTVDVSSIEEATPALVPASASDSGEEAS